MSHNIKHLTLPLLLLLFFAPRQLIAQQTNMPASPRLEGLRAKGSDALLNLDYDAARETFKEIIHEFPDEPVGPRMLAWTTWLETLNKSRLQQGAIYSSQSFTQSVSQPDAKTVQEFRDATRRAEQLARALVQRKPHDPQALYELGSVETLNASFAMTAQGRYLAALRDASSGVDKLREVLKLDPNFHDAELTIGLYDYVLGSLPLAAKLATSFLGERGSKKRGLQALERVAKEGYWEHDDAKLLVMALYKSQKRFAESLTLSRELQEKYPRNYLFPMETADTLIAQAADERRANRIAAADTLQNGALNIFAAELNPRANPRMPDRALALVHFRYGEALLSIREAERAAREFLAATTFRDTEGELITRGHLRAAQSFDFAGKRSEALAEYQVVLTRPNARDLQEQARRGLKAPYKIPT